MRLVQQAAQRSMGKGADIDLVASVTPPAEFTPSGKPDGYEWMGRGACFRNAFTLAASSDSLLYGEGYALFPLSEDEAIWVHHAWVLDLDYQAVDVTWRRAGLRYIGIGVSPDELGSRQIRKRKSHLVEPVLATMCPIVGNLADARWDLAGWFTGRPGQARAGMPLEAGP